jgi:hypothetical protein
MAADLHQSLFVQCVSLFLEVAPKPLRELFRNRWDARYRDDKWHAGDGSPAECAACAKLLMGGSDVCTIQLPYLFTRGKGNVLEPEGPVAPKDYLKPGDRVHIVRTDASGNILQSVDARFAKMKGISLDMSVTVEAVGLLAPTKPEPGWQLFAPRVHTSCYSSTILRSRSSSSRASPNSTSQGCKLYWSLPTGTIFSLGAASHGCATW